LEQRPAVLLIHDGELAELGRLVAGLDVELQERVGAPTRADRARGFDLALGSPRRLIELEGGPGRVAARIAALAGDSRTARAMLARSGIRLLVRLPVHPAALRLLVLHALYRGPERRRAQRAGIGVPVLVRSRLRRRKAILVDLSVRSCRLVTTDPLLKGRRLSLALPGELAGGKPLALRGVASRVSETDPRMPGVDTVVVLFEGISPRDQQRLAGVVAAHAGGTAVCPPEARAPLADPAAWPGAAAAAAVPDPEARLLLGREVSPGGMRVEPHPELRVGDELELALHLGVRADPLGVAARVERDDGADGLVLAFHALAPTDREELERLLALLPVVEMPESGEELSGLVVSEIRGRSAAAA